MVKFIGYLLIVWLAVSSLEEVFSSQTYLSDFNCSIQVPDAFSPNGDGINDVFHVETVCHFSDFSLKIYSEKAELLYVIPHSSDSWDGRIGSRVAPEGKYSWKMVYHVDTGERKVQRGHLLLIR
mgnify:CR=1 FL=1